jgi:hypothetical protein
VLKQFLDASVIGPSLQLRAGEGAQVGPRYIRLAIHLFTQRDSILRSNMRASFGRKWNGISSGVDFRHTRPKLK